MPRGDGTGPMGQGPMTGRGAGYCAGFSTPGYVSTRPRLGMGFRHGAGYGAGRGRARAPVQNMTTATFNPQIPQQTSAPTQAANPNVQPQTQAQPSTNQNVQMLADQVAALEEQINQIKTAINQLTG